MSRTNGLLSSPDGEDPLTKLKVGLKTPILVGFGLGMLLHGGTGAAMESPVLIGRMIHTAFPIAGMSFLFTSSSFISGHIRKKSDVFNNIVGLISVIPVIRKFYPLSLTLPLVSFATMCVITVRCLSEGNTEGADNAYRFDAVGTTVDWYLWSQSKPESEPYIKRTKTDLFLLNN